MLSFLLLGSSSAFDYMCTKPPLTSITYSKNGVNCGNVLTPQQTATEPSIAFHSASPDHFYTILMIDPDAPSSSQPTLSPIRHWAVGNVKGQDLLKGKVEGSVLSKYIGPGPPITTGLHRYHISAWLQPNKTIHFQPLPADILNWNFEKWASNLSLKLVAANYFVAQWTDAFDYNCTKPPLPVAFATGTVNCGTVVTPKNSENAPRVSFAEADEHTGYTVMMIDPDAPSRSDSKLSPIRHWVVVNIKGSDLKKADLSKGQVVSPYMGPAPPTHTGFHRYSVTLWKQHTETTLFTDVGQSPLNFDFASWAQTNKLVKVAANYFVSEAN